MCHVENASISTLSIVRLVKRKNRLMINFGVGVTFMRSLALAGIKPNTTGDRYQREVSGFHRFELCMMGLVEG